MLADPLSTSTRESPPLASVLPLPVSMETNLLRIPFLYSKSSSSSPSSSTSPLLSLTKHHLQAFIRCQPPQPRSPTVAPINSSRGNGNDPPPPITPPVTPPETVEIRFRRGSRKRRQTPQQDVGVAANKEAEAAPRPKDWEDMSITEKAIELYMGEKGLLFWLNKFAYACIFVVIGGWILFRFVGPALDLYQLDSAPLSPSSMFKGS